MMKLGDDAGYTDNSYNNDFREQKYILIQTSSKINLFVAIERDIRVEI